MLKKNFLFFSIVFLIHSQSLQGQKIATWEECFFKCLATTYGLVATGFTGASAFFYLHHKNLKENGYAPRQVAKAQIRAYTCLGIGLICAANTLILNDCARPKQ